MANIGANSFIQLLETIADNKYVLGDRLVEIGVGGPDLEASLSSVAMAQGELGHARLLYNWSFDLKGMIGKKQDVRQQTGKAFGFAVKVNDWLSLIAAAYTINIGVHTALTAVFQAGHADVAARIHKLVREQEDHIIYSKGWAIQLLHDSGAVPYKFRAVLEPCMAEVRAWLAGLEADRNLIAGGYIKENAGLTARWDEETEAVLALRTAANG